MLSLGERFPNREFLLEDVYRFEFELQRIYPDNKHIRPKFGSSFRCSEIWE